LTKAEGEGHYGHFGDRPFRGKLPRNQENKPVNWGVGMRKDPSPRLSQRGRTKQNETSVAQREEGGSGKTWGNIRGKKTGKGKKRLFQICSEKQNRWDKKEEACFKRSSSGLAGQNYKKKDKKTEQQGDRKENKKSWVEVIRA